MWKVVGTDVVQRRFDCKQLLNRHIYLRSGSADTDGTGIVMDGHPQKSASTHRCICQRERSESVRAPAYTTDSRNTSRH